LLAGAIHSDTNGSKSFQPAYHEKIRFVAHPVQAFQFFVDRWPVIAFLHVLVVVVVVEEAAFRTPKGKEVTGTGLERSIREHTGSGRKRTKTPTTSLSR
jgi:hypothetical protein